ncbi:hypothetical protein OSTOST_21944, partial [Ostertagia ostertagi]
LQSFIATVLNTIHGLTESAGGEIWTLSELKSNRAQDGACPTLLRSLAAWSVWTAAFSLFFAVAVVVTYMPSALSCQEIFMVDYLGVYSVLPFILIPIVMMAAGLTNRWSCCSSTAHVRVFNSVSAGLTALLFIALPIVFHLQEPSATVYFLMLLLAPLGLCVSGVLRSLCLVGRVYTQHITAFIGVSFAVAFHHRTTACLRRTQNEVSCSKKFVFSF